MSWLFDVARRPSPAVVVVVELGHAGLVRHGLSLRRVDLGLQLPKIRPKSVDRRN